MKRTMRVMTTKMRTSKGFTRAILALILCAAPVSAICIAALTAPSLGAQTSTATRTVDGKVVGKGDAPLAGAVVYLKDTRSLSVKTFICDEEGKFHFGQLGQNTDYELWSEFNHVKSNNKSISSFDDKKSYYFTLTVKQ
jgi:hypothetical protein